MGLWCTDAHPHVCFHASGQAKGIWELAGIEWRDDMRVYLPVRIVCACARVRVHVHASVALHGCDSMCVCARRKHSAKHTKAAQEHRLATSIARERAH